MRSQDWEYLPFFLAVARGGSLRAGARLLDVNYGTLNRNIQALEASYGVALFTRSRKGFTLTEAGEALLPVAEEAEDTILAARRRVTGLDRSETGTVRFSLPPVLAYDIVAPIIGRFHERYPDIQIEMRVTQRVEDIPGNETDVSLRGADSIDEDVVARRLYQLATGIYASRTYIERHFAEAGPQGAGLHWVGWPEGARRRFHPEQSPFPHAGLRHMVMDGPMRFQLVRAHCGMSYMPCIFEEIYPDIAQVPGTEITLGSYLWIVLHADLRRTVRVRRFVDFLTAEMMALKPRMQAGASI